MPSWLDFNQIADWVSGAWWSYPLIFGVAMVDAFFPVVPSETVVIIAGNLAASGDLNLGLVILLGAPERWWATTSRTASARSSASAR